VYDQIIMETKTNTYNRLAILSFLLSLIPGIMTLLNFIPFLTRSYSDKYESLFSRIGPMTYYLLMPVVFFFFALISFFVSQKRNQKGRLLSVVGMILSLSPWIVLAVLFIAFSSLGGGGTD